MVTCREVDVVFKFLVMFFAVECMMVCVGWLVIKFHYRLQNKYALEYDEEAQVFIMRALFVIGTVGNIVETSFRLSCVLDRLRRHQRRHSRRIVRVGHNAG